MGFVLPDVLPPPREIPPLPSSTKTQAAKAQTLDWPQKAKATILRHPVIALGLLTLLFHLPGLTSLPPLDRDEARFAQATAQMLESGDYIDIRFQNTPRYNKPIGIYWLQSLSVKAFSHVEAREIWAYRIPSFLGALVAVLLTFWGGRRLFGTVPALIGAAVLCTSLALVAESTIAKTDAALLACITAAEMALGRIYCDARAGAAAKRFGNPGLLALTFWIALGFSLLLKGPIGPLVIGLTLGALALADRDAGWMRRLSWLPGLVIVAIIGLPWMVAIWIRTDGAFFAGALGDIFPKITSGAESHWGPPLYYAALSPILLWPGALFLLPSLLTAWRQRAVPAVRFCLAWVVPNWLFFELIPTKLPHYVLPTFPALALLCALALNNGGQILSRRTPLFRWLAWSGAALWGLVCALLAAGMVALPMVYGDGAGFGAGLGAALVLLLGLITLSLFNRDRWRPAALASFITAWTVFTLLLQVTLPGLTRLDVSRQLADLVHRLGPPPRVAVAGYSEPSIVFLLGTDTRLTTGAGAANFLAAQKNGLAVVEERSKPAFLKRINAAHTAVEARAHLEGFNYSRGQAVAFTLYRRTARETP